MQNAKLVNLNVTPNSTSTASGQTARKAQTEKMTHTPFIIDMTMRFWRTASDVPFFSSVISALYSVYSSVPPLERIRSCYTAHWACRPSVMVSANLDKVSIVLLWWTFRVAQLMCDVEGQLCALNVLIPQCLWLQLGSQALEKSSVPLTSAYVFLWTPRGAVFPQLLHPPSPLCPCLSLSSTDSSLRSLHTYCNTKKLSVTSLKSAIEIIETVKLFNNWQ